MDPRPSLYYFLAADRRFHAFFASLKISGLEHLLREEGPFTVFAPTDEAFHRVPIPLLDMLLASPEKLGRLVSFHVLPEKLSLAMLKTIDPRQKVLGKRFSLFRGSVRVNGSRVVQADAECANGIVHVLDGVLMPEKERYVKLVRKVAFQRSRLLARSGI